MHLEQAIAVLRFHPLPRGLLIATLGVLAALAPAPRCSAVPVA